MAFKIGDKVVLMMGTPLYKSSNALISATKLKASKITNITRVVTGKHPYNTTGDLGWCDEKYISLYQEEKPKDKYEMEIELIDKDDLIEYLKENNDKVIVIKSKDIKKVFGI